MYRYIILFSFLASFTFASDQVEIVAKNAIKDGDVIKANDGVVLFYDGYMIESKKVEYDTVKKVVKLQDNVTLYKDDLVQAKTDMAMLDLISKDVEFKPLLLVEQKSSVWTKGECATKKGNVYNITNSLISSCNINDPDWKISYSSAKFHADEDWFLSYNNTFYIGDIPVFYLPIFGLPTSKKRRSGFLIPKLSYSSDDGISYMQPIYFVGDKNWDIELNPQYKTDKGGGLYTTLRFVDSKTSKGVIKAGFFNTENNYFDEENLKHRNFYGFEVLYESDSIFNKYTKNYSDGLLIDATWLNDIGYDSHQYNKIEKHDDYGTRNSQLVTSTINYFIGNEKRYFGLNSKMFIDTTKSTNRDTFQMFPSLNYHIFKDSILHKNILYSLDTKITNYTRRDGYTIQQYEFDVPIGFSWSFFNDYLGVSISENLYGTYLNYNDLDTNQENGSFVNNFHKISVFTNLSKKYDNFFHDFNLYVNYILPSFDKKDGWFSPFIDIDTSNEHLELKLEEFFYTNQDIEISHFVNQKIYMNEYDYKYADLENELKIKINKNLYVESIISYSHEHSKISNSLHTLRYTDEANDIAFSHSFSDTSDDGTYNFFDVRYDKTISPRDDVYFDIQYNYENDFIKNVEVGWIYKKDCWSTKLSLRKQRVPKLQSDGSNSIINKGIYLEFTLLPFGKSLKVKDESY